MNVSPCFLIGSVLFDNWNIAWLVILARNGRIIIIAGMSVRNFHSKNNENSLYL